MDRAQNPKGKAVEGRSREDIDVGDYSESHEEEEKIFTAIEENLSMFKFYSESSFTYPVEEYKEMFNPVGDPSALPNILQALKASIAQIQSSKQLQTPTWPKVEVKAEKKRTRFRIEDEMGKEEIA
ncbi:hypothetical protein K3495_g4383 [Podosphaera aphanis]|nr:hypothetical protein K3495_g4383 [Podosphaera aphanis]